MHAVVRAVARLIPPLPSTYWYLWIGTLINRIGGFVAPFLALYLTSSRAFNAAQAALVVSLFGAGSLAARMPGGEVADRFGRKPVLLVSFFATPPVMIAVGLFHDIYLIGAATLLLGFTTDLYRPAVSASVADVAAPELRVRAYGYLYWAINIGAAVAPIVAGVMARHNYFYLFLGDAVTTFLYGLIVALRVKETRPQLVARESPVAAGFPPSAGTVHNRTFRERMRVVAHEPILLFFVLFSLLDSIVYAQSVSTLPIDMSFHGLGPARYGLAIAINGVLITLIGLPINHAAERWRRFRTMAMSSFMLGAGFGLGAFASRFAQPFALYAVSIAVWTIGEILSAAVAPTVVADLAPSDLRGLYLGVHGIAWSLSFLIGPLAGGWVLQRFGSNPLWSSCFALSLLSTIGFLCMIRPAARRMPLRRSETPARRS